MERDGDCHEFAVDDRLDEHRAVHHDILGKDYRDLLGRRWPPHEVYVDWRSYTDAQLRAYPDGGHPTVLSENMASFHDEVERLLMSTERTRINDPFRSGKR